MGPFFRDERPLYDTSKEWSVFSVRKAQEIFKTAREKQLSDWDHEGRLLLRHLDDIRVAQAEKCKSERQARFLASNGQTWPEFKRRIKAGEPKLLTYMNNENMFVCVETAVMNRMWLMERITWHGDFVRDRLFQEEGEAVLPKLCKLYRPPPMTPEEAEAMAESGSYRIRERPARLYGDPPVSVPTEKRWYVIVDVWAFKAARRDAESRARTSRRYAHDGECMLFAMREHIQATAPLRAKELYRDRYLDGKDLPIGKYLALPKSLFDKVAAMTVLPRDLTRESIDRAARASTPEAEAKREAALLASSSHDVGHDPWNLAGDAPPGFYRFDPATREPGEDFEPGQLLPLLGQDEAAVSNFASVHGNPPEAHVEMKIRREIPSGVFPIPRVDPTQLAFKLPDPSGPYPLTYREHQWDEAERQGLKILDHPPRPRPKPRRNPDQAKLFNK